MERYKNLGGTSNIVAFEVAHDSITVQFGDGSIYLYTAASAGAANLAEMQRLATAGQGLNSFIGRVVKKGYARIIR